MIDDGKPVDVKYIWIFKKHWTRFLIEDYLPSWVHGQIFFPIEPSMLVWEMNTPMTHLWPVVSH